MLLFSGISPSFSSPCHSPRSTRLLSSAWTVDFEDMSLNFFSTAPDADVATRIRRLTRSIMLLLRLLCFDGTASPALTVGQSLGLEVRSLLPFYGLLMFYKIFQITSTLAFGVNYDPTFHWYLRIITWTFKINKSICLPSVNLHVIQTEILPKSSTWYILHNMYYLKVNHYLVTEQITKKTKRLRICPYSCCRNSRWQHHERPKLS